MTFVAFRRMARPFAFGSMIACGSVVTDGATPQIPTQAASDGPYSIALEPNERELLVGQSQAFRGRILGRGGETVSWAELVWRSSDSSVAAVEAVSATGASFVNVRALRPGQMELSAQGRGVSAAAEVSVYAVATAPSSIRVERFELIEFQYSPPSGQWYYAPRLILRDVSGRPGGAVIGIEFDVPGLGLSPRCAMHRGVGEAPGELFQDAYGDYELTLDRPGMRVESGSEAVARITVLHSDSTGAVLSVAGRIVAGSLPAEYEASLGGSMRCGI